MTLTIAIGCGDRGRDPSPAPASEVANAEAGESPAAREWQQVDEGVRYREVGTDGRFTLHAVELDPKRWVIDVSSGPRRSMSDAVASSRARFAINANFFDVNDRALGVVVSSGRIVQGAHPVSWQSIFSITRDGEARISTRDGWGKKASSVFAAVQAGPRLVVDGERNEVAKGERSLRSGVCITRDGAVRFFATSPGTFLDVHETLDLAAKSDAEDGLGCRDAMLFDGGPSAQIYLDTPGKKLSMDGDVVPVYVVARPRE